MSPNRTEVLDLITHRPDVAHGQIADALNLPEPSVRREVRALEKAGLVKCTGTHVGTGQKSWAAVSCLAAQVASDPEMERARRFARSFAGTP